jgi:hypothetical protein
MTDRYPDEWYEQNRAHIATLRAERDAALAQVAQLRGALVRIQETHDGYPLSDAEVIRTTYAIADAALTATATEGAQDATQSTPD